MIDPWRRDRLRRQLAAATPERRASAFRYYREVLREPTTAALNREFGAPDGNTKITLLSLLFDPIDTLDGESIKVS